MGLIFRTRLFADYTNAEKKYIRGSIAREAAEKAFKNILP